jgi:DNA-directed RNA polymerase subunit RPC12/RpoP
MSLVYAGICARCHRPRRLDQSYPSGLCAECASARLFGAREHVTHGGARPREQYVSLPVEDVDPAFAAQAHVECLGEVAPGWVVFLVKHWAKTPYRVTRGTPS